MARLSSDGVEAQVAQLRNLLEGHERRLQEVETQLEASTKRLEDVGQPLKLCASGRRAPSATASAGLAPESPRPEPAPCPQSASGPTCPRGHLASNPVDALLRRRGEDVDPFERMWSAAKVSQMRVFDQDQLKAIHAKSANGFKNQGVLFGGFFMSILSLPFGPIGMAAGGLFGAICGGLIGWLVETRRRRLKIKESEFEKNRLRSLVRWATDCFSEDDQVLQLIEMVVLEFKPMADIASGSKNARKSLKALDYWICQKPVKRQLLVYVENLLGHWQDLSRADFLRCMLVLQTLAATYQTSARALDEHEKQFVKRIDRLLANSSVKSVMDHAQRFPTKGNLRVMECMVYADITRNKRKTSRSVEDGTKSPILKEDDVSVRSPEGDSDLSDEGEDRLSIAASNRDEDEIISAGSVRKVLKKPFFRNWDDFMEFDCTFKHKMPITLSEFELLLHKEKESLKGWDVCVDRKEIKVAKVMLGDAGVTLRAWATVPGVSIFVAFYLFHDFSRRVGWDKVFSTMSLVGDSAQGSDVLYSVLKAPGVTPRDFLQFRRAKMQEDGSILMMLRSAEHPDMPENKNYIRAESYISGYVLRQGYEKGQPVLNIFLMSCSDIKGLVPKWVISYMAPRKPGEWVESLRKACVEYQQSNPDYVERLQEYANLYRDDVPFDYEVEEGLQAAPALQAEAVVDLEEGSPDSRYTGRRGEVLRL